MSKVSNDHAWMAHALRLASRGLYTTDPNPRVGCVIVANGALIAEGWHEEAGGPHAEAMALSKAGAAARGATAYVTLEPCSHHGRTPPCADAMIEAGVARVVVGTVDPNPAVSGRGLAKLRDAGIAVDTALLEADCAALNPGFAKRMRTGTPWIRSKIAASLDGRTALANGVSQWITAPAARDDVQRWRARSSAILTGAGTVIADNPSLNVRATTLGAVKQPAIVVADSKLRLSPDARLLSSGGAVHIFCVDADAARRQALADRGACIEPVTGREGRVDLAVLVARLGSLEFNEVLVEAGPELNGALLAAGLIDELLIYTAPHILGDTARGMFVLPALEKMEHRDEWQICDVRRVGRDLRTILRKE